MVQNKFKILYLVLGVILGEIIKYTLLLAN